MTQLSIEPNEAVPYTVRLSDNEFLVVDKPSGVVTEPGKGHRDDSLLNGLFCEYGPQLQNLGEERSWGLLHRLDKDTSGLVLVALRNRAYASLRDQFEKRLVKKMYWAIVEGVPSPARAVVQDPIAEVETSRKRAVIRRDGKQAITAYEVVANAGGVSLIVARPKTGRLHQIRLHMAHRGHPVLGDGEYGGSTISRKAARLCLHAAELSFLHPTDGHRIVVTSPMPADMQRVCRKFGLPIPATP